MRDRCCHYYFVVFSWDFVVVEGLNVLRHSLGHTLFTHLVVAEKLVSSMLYCSKYSSAFGLVFVREWIVDNTYPAHALD